MGATQKDIAEALGLSVTSVSLVLSGRPNRISKEKRALILEAAARMHYIPNQNAVGLAKKQSSILGVILPDIGNMFFSELVSGIDDIAREKGWNLIIINTDDEADRDIKSIRMLASRDVDAIIMIQAAGATAKMNEQYLTTLEAFGKPVILADRYSIALNCSSVTVNQKKGGYLACKHLLELGHSRVAFLTGPRYHAIDRLDGAAEAMREFGLDILPEDVFAGDYHMQSGFEAAGRMLARDFTAVFSFNDMMAYGIYKRCREAGVRIPQDLSVVSFDDIFFSDYLEVPLTAVRQPANAIGQEAARRAFYEIEHRDVEKKSITYEPVLTVRKSTSPPKGGAKASSLLP